MRESACFDIEGSEEEWLKHLEEQGFVVLTNVASHATCDAMRACFWDWASPFSTADDPASWASLPAHDYTGIIAGHGIGQSQFAWHARSIPGVRRAFAAIWRDDDVITSFDGANVFRPFREPSGSAGLRTASGWWHVDQGARKRGRHAVQGALSLTASSAATGGLAVRPGSHKAHDELLSRFPESTQDFVVLPEGDPVLQQYPGVLVVNPPGSLLLWDSRCVHCNSPALVDSEIQGAPQLLRLVAYVCMTPRKRADADTLAARRLAVDQGATTTHWPHELRITSRASPGQPGLVGALATLSDVQRDLV